MNPTVENHSCRLCVICFVESLIVGLSCGVCAFVVGVLILPNNTTWNTEKRFVDDFSNNVYTDIVKGTVPFVQNWFRHLDPQPNHEDFPYDSGLLPMPWEKPLLDPDSSCFDAWLADLSEYVPETSPAIIELVLYNMGLRKSFPARKHLRMYLQGPQPVSGLFNNSLSCIEKIQGAAELACSMRENSAWDLQIDRQRHYLTYSVHVGVVLDSLTHALQTDFDGLSEIVDTMQHESWTIQKENPLTSDSELEQFRLDKYVGVAQSMKLLAGAVTTSNFVPAAQALSINVLEAVKVDVLGGNEENAQLGLALATRAGVENTISDNKVRSHLSEDWIHAYMVWNFSFVYGNISPLNFAKLTIPTVTCAATDNNGEDWLLIRTISLALSLMLRTRSLPRGWSVALPDNFDYEDVVQAERTFWNDKGDRSRVADIIGKINLRTAQITSPSRDNVEEMLYSVCGDFCHDRTWGGSGSDTLLPHAQMNEDQFKLYYAGFLWVTGLLVGLGSELLFWLFFLQHFTKKREIQWQLVQFAFPLVLSTSLGLAIMQNFLALPFAVAGLWHFGFPETSMYLYLGIYGSRSTTTVLQRRSDFLNGVALVIHHSATLWAIASLLSGVVRPERVLVSPCLLVVMQHWFTLLSYSSYFWYYVAIELIIEFLFEWMIITYLQDIYAAHWSAAQAGLLLLLSHWIFLIAGALQIVNTKFRPPNDRLGNVMARGTACSFAELSPLDTLNDYANQSEPELELGSRRLSF